MENQTIWLYFFSSVYQGNLALLALIGVFGIFRLQQIKSEMQSFETRIETFVRDYMLNYDSRPTPLPYSNLNELDNLLRKMAADGTVDSPRPNGTAINLLRHNTYLNLRQGYSGFNRKIKKVELLILLVIVLSGAVSAFALFALNNYTNLNKILPDAEVYTLNVDIIAISVCILFIGWSIHDSESRIFGIRVLVSIKNGLYRRFKHSE